jgi:hypothetical protein
MTDVEKAEWYKQYRMVRKKIRDNGRSNLNQEDREILKKVGDYSKQESE